MALIRTSTDFTKYNAFVEGMISDSMKNRSKVSHGANMEYVIVNNRANKQALKKYLTESFTNKKHALNEIMLETVEGAHINFGSLHKPNNAQKVANKGDVGEGIFSAALFARFVSKSKNITVKDVHDVLKKASTKVTPSAKGKKTVKVFLKTKSVNKNGVTKDDIELTIILAKSNMDSLMNSSLWAIELKEIFEASVKYANSGTVKKWADLLWKNNQENLIEIISAGTEDQSGTKVDVFVLIDRNKVDINVSLKVGDVKQFGQLGGTDFDKIHGMWSSLGVDIKHTRKKYYEFLGKKDVIGGFNIIYNTVVNKKTINVGKFKDFIRYNATLNEEGVKLVQLDGSLKVYDFDKLKKARIDKIYTRMIKDKEGKPSIIFHDNSKDLLQIRMKKENKPTSEFGVYIRTLIEKQHGLTDLIAEVHR